MYAKMVLFLFLCGGVFGSEITKISPSTTTAGNFGGIMVITGSGFAHKSKVKINGVLRTTKFLNSTALQIDILPDDIVQAGSVGVEVVGSTNQVSLTVNAAAVNGQGSKGDAGADGSMGPQGPKGDKGDSGAQGIPGANGNSFEFTVNFDGSGNPTTATNLPVGWSYSLTGLQMTITHTVGSKVKFATYFGIDASNVRHMRYPTGANELTYPEASATTQFTITVTSNICGCAGNAGARVVVQF